MRPIGRSRSGIATIALASITATLVASCGDKPAATPAPTPLTLAQQMDPANCQSCHQDHFSEWQQSMHAYAGDDPLFIAMNARGQRETSSTLGTFCVKCHAPVAVQLGTTTDGLNLATLPAWQRGVTCYACHSVDEVGDAHNNGLHNATDGVMRATIPNPTPAPPHGTANEPLLDGSQLVSSSMCGSCHDIETPAPAAVDVARTYHEWQGSLFAQATPATQLTCIGCHMPGSNAPASNASGAPVRRVHDHSMPGVDSALIAFPTAAQAAAGTVNVQAFLDPAIVSKLCVTPVNGGTQMQVTLDDAFAGHDFPSGAAYHRRVWVEVIGYSAGTLVYQSGVIADDVAVTSITAAADPDLWVIADQMKDATNAPTEMLWDATSYTSTLLPPAVTADPTNPLYFHAVTHNFNSENPAIDHVTMRLRVRPVDHDFVDTLVTSGDLDASYENLINTLDVAAGKLDWTIADGAGGCVPQ